MMLKNYTDKKKQRRVNYADKKKKKSKKNADKKRQTEEQHREEGNKRLQKKEKKLK